MLFGKIAALFHNRVEIEISGYDKVAVGKLQIEVVVVGGVGLQLAAESFAPELLSVGGCDREREQWRLSFDRISLFYCQL